MGRKTATAIGVLTSGGVAPGMNAALRAVIRTAVSHHVAVYAIYEGYQGMVDGCAYIRAVGWGDTGGIMQRGGTVIGTARCKSFRTREGRLQAVRNLIECGIDRLVVIGGDGSLTGANLLRQEWKELVAELAAQGSISPETAAQHTSLSIVGLVGSIDNDFYSTDMTIARALPHEPEPGQLRLRLAVLTAGPAAPGMNTAVWAAVRLAVDRGHRMFAVSNGFNGLAGGPIEEFGWMNVSGWGQLGGSQLGTSRKVPAGAELYAIARTLEAHKIEGLLVIGGWSAYQSAYKLFTERPTFPAFNLLLSQPGAAQNASVPLKESKQ